MAKQDGDGRGWFGDSEGHAEAGKKGGDKVAAERGPEFYEEIGEKGGEASPGKFKKGSKLASDAGRKGAESRNQNR
jgi:general stress protein YciG